MTESVAPAHPGYSSHYRWAGYTIGFSIGGFFDGILLHQVLQWHHLLSGLEGGRFGDLRFQILADGAFHVLMYIVGGVGLWLLWRSRREFGLLKADRFLTANALIGFGVWHMIDGIASHWLLGIHWIKMDSDVPLVWDIVWFTVFGVAFVAWGWMLKPKDPDARGQIGAAPASIVLLAILSGAVALLPPGRDARGATVVVFAPGTSPAQAFTAMMNVGGSFVWSDASDQVWAIELPEDANTFVLYQNGALLVSNTLFPFGCLNWFGSPARQV